MGPAVIKRVLCRWLLNFIRRRNSLLCKLASTEEMRNAIISQENVLNKVLASERICSAVEESQYFNARFLAVLERNALTENAYEKVLSKLAENDNLVGSHKEYPADLLRLFEKALKNNNFCHDILDNIELQKKALSDANFCNFMLSSPEFQQVAVKDQSYVQKMVEMPEFQQVIVENDVTPKQLLLIPEFQKTALEDASFRAKIVHNETVQKETFRVALKNALWQHSFSDLLDILLNDNRLYSMIFANPRLTGRWVQEVAQVDTVCQKIVQQPTLRQMAFEHLVRGSAWLEEYCEILKKLLHDSRTVDLIVNDGALLGRILSSDPAIVRMATMEPVRWKLQLMRVRERAAELPYLLPAVVLSYPRAGSNFLQSVLQGSSGFRCQSIYGELKEGADNTLTVKSHSPSPSYFEHEWRRLIPDRTLPSKIIRLQRDPRDVLISFLEYTEANRKTTIRQEEFLNYVDYFYASTVDRDFLRAHYKQGLTVAQAFKEHVRTWYQEPLPACYEILPVRYEDLVLEPQKTFQSIFDFLNLDCELADKFLKVKVSLYSDTGRARARTAGWRENMERYGVLIQMIQEQLSEEIQLLGYKEVEASDTTEAP